MMKTATTRERPILFTGEMVRAILDDTKTQTRRIARVKPVSFGWRVEGRGGAFSEWGEHIKDPMCARALCPYGQPGDQLWVKETFWPDNQTYLDQYKAEPWLGEPSPDGAEVYYRASEKNPEIFPRWRPSIFMPRWASRIQLLITSIRIEFLIRISPGDAIAEGIERFSSHGRTYYRLSHWENGLGCADPVEVYRRLWESINGAGSWAKNPWVWVIEFRITQ